MGNIPLDYSVIPEGTENVKIKEIALQEGFTDYKLSIGQGSKSGDNFMGAIFQVIIKGVDTNNKYKELNLILKCSGRDERLRDCTENNFDTVLFHREIQMYTVILPTFFEMQFKAGIKNGFFSLAKIYGWSDKLMDEFIIMENKKAHGFEMKNRMEPLNMNHCKLILKQLGYLHAFSFALKELNPQLHKFMAEAYPDVSLTQFFHGKVAKIFGTQLIDKNKQAKMIFDPNTEQDLLNRFLKFSNTCEERLRGFMKLRPDDEHFVMIHGDCWTNNILFKYEVSTEKEKPTEICFIDWQTSKWASPAFDLSYFIYNCIAAETYEKYFDFLIKYYYDNASSMIKQLGVDPEKVYPFSALEKQIEKYFCYGVITSIMTLPMILSDSEEIPNQIEGLTEGGEEKWCYKSKNHAQYVARMRGVLLHAASRNFF